MAFLPTQLPLVITIGAEARRHVLQAQAAGRSVGLVPTMGALHEGHLSLVDASRAECDMTAVSIFVNPTQFAPGEDLDRYPRTLNDDLKKLSSRGVDLVFTPSVDEMYPTGFSTFVDPPEVAARLEGQVRPGHFRGVATVVLKLFHLLPADIAFFGQKDFQQTLVVRHMVRDLGLATSIRVCPTVREPDGLAMSSRNQYLSPEQRGRATAMYRCLELGKSLIQSGAKGVETIREAMRRELLEAGMAPIDYIAIADPETLDELAPIRLPLVLLVAARLGSTRLIDNCLVPANEMSLSAD